MEDNAGAHKGFTEVIKGLGSVKFGGFCTRSTEHEATSNLLRKGPRNLLYQDPPRKKFKPLPLGGFP